MASIHIPSWCHSMLIQNHKRLKFQLVFQAPTFINVIIHSAIPEVTAATSKAENRCNRPGSFRQNPPVRFKLQFFLKSRFFFLICSICGKVWKSVTYLVA